VELPVAVVPAEKTAVLPAVHTVVATVPAELVDQLAVTVSQVPLTAAFPSSPGPAVAPLRSQNRLAARVALLSANREITGTTLASSGLIFRFFRLRAFLWENVLIVLDDATIE